MPMVFVNTSFSCAAAGDTQPPLGQLGKVGDACAGPPAGNIAGTQPITSEGVVDSWTNVLYINEDGAFDFADLGTDQGTLSEFSFYVGAGRESVGMVTPFIAEPLVDNPQSGDDFIVRAIGTMREGGVDWTESGLQTFPFSDTETFEVQSGWLAGFVTADPESLSDLAGSPIPFVANAGVNGWLTGTSTAASACCNRYRRTHHRRRQRDSSGCIWVSTLSVSDHGNPPCRSRSRRLQCRWSHRCHRYRPVIDRSHQQRQWCPI